MVTDGTSNINMDLSETVPDVAEWVGLRLGSVVDVTHNSNKLYPSIKDGEIQVSATVSLWARMLVRGVIGSECLLSYSLACFLCTNLAKKFQATVKYGCHDGMREVEE
jgi:hypothetical protein